MRHAVHTIGSAIFFSLLMTGCSTVRPHVGTGNEPPAVFPTGGRLGPRSGPDYQDPSGARPLIDEICRTQAMPSGYIAIRYLQRDGDCPASTDPGNAYNVMVIEYYRNKPVGAVMVVCADQSVPRDWVREYRVDARADCPGARVRDNAPTVVEIRRVALR